jgi:BlaI family transcriptional regulator, penicillinase repressor
MVHVTDAESVLLDVLWRHGPLPPARLIAEVQAVRPWGAPTIKTLLGRLMHKKAIQSAREEGLLRYRPLIARASYVEAEVTALVERLFGGDPAALSAWLAENGAQT